MTNLSELPSNLPVPQDDGAADQLVGRRIPRLSLRTDGAVVALDALGAGRTILYLYPLSGRPGVDLPSGWDEIPGARGCTPEACDFRDHHAELLDAGADRVFGLSSQDPDYQQELVDRMHLPFPMLSDPELALAEALHLPTFVAGGTRLYRRLTLVIRDGVVEHVFYPVFPPDEHARQVLSWLRARTHRDPASRARWLTAIWGWVRQQLPAAPAAVLEVGCGTEGGFVPRLVEAGYEALGVDPMAPAGPAYRQLTVERVVLDRQVDAVVACTALHHVTDLDEVLTLAAGALSPGGRLVLVEWDWQRFDERTALWCFDRLDGGHVDGGHGWLRHLRDGWRESGLAWSDYLGRWAIGAGLHTGDAMVGALDRHFEARSLTRGAYVFAELPDTTESEELAAIAAGLISATGVRYVGELT